MDFTHDQLTKLYRDMLLIRRFEERVNVLYLEGEVSGTCHLCIGQEAVPVGAVAALEPGDYLGGTHRGHGHFLAKGGEPGRILAEVFGREPGYSRGRGGSQHMASFEVGFLGSNGITGGGLPIATGAALALTQTKQSNVVVAMMGDGAANQGVFHECLNMAALWKLPVVYVCENNLYAMSMPVGRAFASGGIAQRVSAFGVPATEVDGNDVLAVADAVSTAARRARRGDGPTFLECMTYRWCGHSRSDRRVYRTREEEAEWQAKCPIAAFGEVLVADGVATGTELKRIDDDVTKAIADAETFARSAPVPDPATLESDVYEEGRHDTGSE